MYQVGTINEMTYQVFFLYYIVEISQLHMREVIKVNIRYGCGQDREVSDHLV